MQNNRPPSFLLRSLNKIPVSTENLKYYKNIFWMFLRYALGVLYMVVIGSAVIRYLGRAQYGALSYAVSMMTIFFPLASLGIDGVVYRELVLGRYSQSKVLGTAVVLRLI